MYSVETVLTLGANAAGAPLAMAGDDGERRRQAAMGDRDPGGGRDADGGGDPGHDRERHTGVEQRLGLLATASEHVRVATLQPDDPPAPPSRADEQANDEFLGHSRPARPLADEDPLRYGRERQHVLVHECVVQDQIGLSKPFGGTPREKPRIAGTRTDERHEPARRRLIRHLVRAHR